MAEIKLNDETQSLLDEINQQYPGVVLIRSEDQQAGYVRHDQAKQEVLSDGLIITLTDVTAPDYTASHELLHVLMLMKGFPQIFFQVTFGDQKLDEQLMIMATDLYNAAIHLVVVAEQRKHGLIDDHIETLYLKGIDATLTPETGTPDDERTLRLLTLLDACVFYGDHLATVQDHLQELYPQAFEAAHHLYEELTVKAVDSPFAMRRAIVKLFAQFDAQMAQWGLPALHNNEFTTLTSAFSERQLRLQVRQLFEVFHSEMNDRETGEKAYIGLNRTDRQNSFILNPPKDHSADYFKEVYDQTVEDFFKQLKMPYIVRE